MGGRVNTNTSGAIYIGEVVHKRARPKRHSLRYRVFSMCVDLDRLAELDRRLKLFSVDRFNLFSLYRKDFGPHDGSSLSAFIRRMGDAAGVGERVTRIHMLCYPRLLGFSFNPLTVFYLEGAAGELLMLVYEVHNTFGEHHFYEALVTQSGSSIAHCLRKSFYVSPFNTLAGNYRFVIRPPGAEVFTGITLFDTAGGLVTAYFKGRRQPFTDGRLFLLALGYPLMTIKIVAAIYWEALRLWLKGVPPTLHLRPRKAKATPQPK